MISKIKGELAAAVAIAAGLMLVAGYAITWAKLENVGLPTSPALSSLPQSFFLSEAIGDLFLPLTLLGLPAGLVVFNLLNQNLDLGRDKVWSLMGLAFGVAALSFTMLVRARTWMDWSVVEIAANVAALLLTVGLAVLFGRLAARLAGHKPSRLEALQLAAAVLLVVCVASAAAFRFANALTGPNPLPAAAVFLASDDCPPAPDIRFRSPGEEGGGECEIGGLYLGQTDDWVFLGRLKSSARSDFPSRLLALPRDRVRLGAIADGDLVPTP